MNFRRLGKSFNDAGKGIVYVFEHEQNFRLQIYTTILVLFLVWLFDLSRSEMIVIFLLILAVLILELLNSAVERLSDVLKPRLSDQVALVKEIMAGMVLLSSLGAGIIGLIIFWPHIVELLDKIW